MNSKELISMLLKENEELFKDSDRLIELLIEARERIAELEGEKEHEEI